MVWLFWEWHRPKDRLIVLHIYTVAGLVIIEGEGGEEEGVTSSSSSPPPPPPPASVGSKESLEQRYTDDMKERGLMNCEVVAEAKEPGVPLHEQVLRFSTKHLADFLVLAPRMKETVSSVCTHAILKGKANILVVKSL